MREVGGEDTASVPFGDAVAEAGAGYPASNIPSLIHIRHIRA